MKRVWIVTAALMLSCLTFTPASALTEDEQAQLDAISQNIVDASAGVKVGSATVTAERAVMLRGEDACTYDRLVNAQDPCVIDAVLFAPDGAPLDSIYYEPSEEIGYVDMEEWTEDANSQIDEIWEGYVEGAKEQSERLGYTVTPLKWVLYPTLNKDTKVMTYGILLDFGGEEAINLHSVKFTRSGYVKMTIVTFEDLLAATDSSFDDATGYASASYAPDEGFRYADFKDGDKIAAVGAVGVLASVMGVQYTKKGTLAAIGAAILLFAKKFWFLLIAIPGAGVAAVRKFFRRNKSAE